VVSARRSKQDKKATVIFMVIANLNHFSIIIDLEKIKDCLPTDKYNRRIHIQFEPSVQLRNIT